MSERKIVKLRVDMYSDTKFKIIDTMEERDVIHYIWTRLLTLAGKVNLEGHLYLSKSIPYTIETLALEFNRSFEKVELALKVFMDLEMIELTEGNVYRVKNFVKHQNIKSKKKVDILETEKSKLNNSKVIDFESTPKTDIDLKDGIRIKDNMKIKYDNIDNSVLVEDFDKLEITNNIKQPVDKSSLDKNLLGNEVNSEDKMNVEKEFVLSKGSSKKKKCKSKKKDDDNIELCEDDDSTELCEDGKNNEELCEFGDKIPEGKVITIFKV
ncbi:phage replisome organizer N-terminal domain-containing protein [Clostridium weizhouense]|uniref:Phage replisome organizer N-terminal domain-containing protein n=1 Tax=Clostridium weizhouense TaxID=2859781 RepID=A0ABS7ANM6_9CLOT|nr:phage replisome organizer N-terminal domain-containing protein [Clostridium weizhouense]MBW6410274.1 phage replisome organizer N-terminal domain-containing protein [Clostridium weizhouense]